MVVPAALIALVLGVFFHYVPVLYVCPAAVFSPGSLNELLHSHHIFQTSNVPAEFFFLPIAFGLGLLVYVFVLDYARYDAHSNGSVWTKCEK